MKKRVFWGVLIIALLGSVFLPHTYWDFFKIDACLDAGGRWNEVIRKCETDEASGATQQ